MTKGTATVARGKTILPDSGVVADVTTRVVMDGTSYMMNIDSSTKAIASIRKRVQIGEGHSWERIDPASDEAAKAKSLI